MPENTPPHPAKFFNRELSWLEFNQRVLAQAQDSFHPLLERVKFLSITASNLDEFFMVRVAGLLDQIEAGVAVTSPDAQTPQQTLTEIREQAIARLATS